jgi:hypothetical protein
MKFRAAVVARGQRLSGIFPVAPELGTYNDQVTTFRRGSEVEVGRYVA